MQYWRKLCDEGWDGFNRVEARNKGYTTVALTIPIVVLKSLLPDMAKIKSSLTEDLTVEETQDFKYHYEY